MSDTLVPAPAAEAAPEPAAFPAAAFHPSWSSPAPAVHPSWTQPAPAAAAAPAPAAAVPASAAPEASAGVQPSVCNDFLCGSRRFVYALGQLDYDFNSEANRDWFAQRVDHPDDPSEMLRYLGEDMDTSGDDAGAPSHAAALTWVLKLDATPIYAIQPLGPFAERAYGWLRVFLRDQVREGVEMISVPGVLQGRTTLMSGQTVPVIIPDHRGMYAWSVERLVESAAEEAGGGDLERGGLDNFLRRVYYELRNLGVTPQERALNYAATNAFQLANVYGAAVRSGLELDGIKVRPSPICRPGSDCWDVEIVFFDPENLNRASRVYRFTVDVSDALPVAVGGVRSWTSR